MSDLRERLTTILMRVAAKEIEYAVFSSTAVPVDGRLVADRQFKALADECIRQMEWARKELRRPCPYDCRGCPECGESPNPLTFAPEDWKP